METLHIDTSMRNGQRMNLEQLRLEADEAIYRARKKRIEVAEEMGVSPGSISSALNNAGTRWASMQIRIIERYTDYEIKPEPTYIALKKQENDDGSLDD